MLVGNHEFVENMLVMISRAGVDRENKGLLERIGEIENAAKGKEELEFVYLSCRSILMDSKI
jgi:hypothetical protein